jgi:hypothetical protein
LIELAVKVRTKRSWKEKNPKMKISELGSALRLLVVKAEMSES